MLRATVEDLHRTVQTTHIDGHPSDRTVLRTVTGRDAQRALAEWILKLARRTVFTLVVFIALVWVTNAFAEEAPIVMAHEGNSTVSCIGCVVTCTTKKTCDYSV